MGGIFKKSQTDSGQPETINIGSGNLRLPPMTKDDILLFVSNAPNVKQIEIFAQRIKENNPNASSDQLAAMLEEKIKQVYGKFIDDWSKKFNLK
jgi:hypothetical protein